MDESTPSGRPVSNAPGGSAPSPDAPSPHQSPPASDIAEAAGDNRVEEAAEGGGAAGSPAPAETMLALRKFVRVAQRTPAVVARRAGLSHSELQVLELLSDGATSPAELSRLVGVTSAAMSGIVDRLVARGHASRAPHPDDGRRTVVEISESGRAEAIGHMAPMLDGLVALDASMTPEERATVVRFLKGATTASRQLEGP